MVAPAQAQLRSVRTLAGELSTCSANDRYPDTGMTSGLIIIIASNNGYAADQ